MLAHKILVLLGLSKPNVHPVDLKAGGKLVRELVVLFVRLNQKLPALLELVLLLYAVREDLHNLLDYVG